MPHTKPTQEELQANIDNSLKELEVADKAPVEEKKEVEVVEPAQEVEAEEKEVEKEPVEVEAEKEEAPTPEDELKKKLSNSAREAQVLQSRTKKYDEAVAQAESIAEPTDEIMVKEYGNDGWNDMTTVEQKLAKKNWMNEQKFNILSAVSKEGRDIEKWNATVDAFIGDPKTLIAHPQLEGKVEDFKLFAMKPSRRGLDFEDLLLAFNGNLALNPPVKNKGKMFETGTAGQGIKQAPKDDKISPEQAAVLMNTDYKKYKEMLIAGKIRNI